MQTPLKKNIIDIALEQWNPQEHYEELISKSPPVGNSFNYTNEGNILNSTTANEIYSDAMDAHSGETNEKKKGGIILF